MNRSQAKLDALCAEYAEWNKSQNLNLGNADEHIADEELTDQQRGWLVDFCKRWNEAKREAEQQACIFCGETRDTHDQIICDAIRATLAARAKRAA